MIGNSQSAARQTLWTQLLHFKSGWAPGVRTENRATHHVGGVSEIIEYIGKDLFKHGLRILFTFQVLA